MAEAKKRTALDIIRSYDGPKIRIMEVCGTHTHEIFRQGIRQILPPQVDVISGRRARSASRRSAISTRLSGWLWKRRHHLHLWRPRPRSRQYDEPG